MVDAYSGGGRQSIAGCAEMGDAGVELAAKTCHRCAVEKPLVEFGRDKNKPDGYCYWCKRCVNATAQAARKTRRAAMGDEAWFAHQQAVQRASRQRTGNSGREYTAAYRAALKKLVAACPKQFAEFRSDPSVTSEQAAARLVKAHPTAFQSLLRAERYARGLL